MNFKKKASVKKYKKQMTTKQADHLVELLVKMVKLQRLMEVATCEQRSRILEAADKITDEIVDKYDGDKTWCMALLTFGGQYYGQDTKNWIGNRMSDTTVADALRKEVYWQNRLKIEEEEDETREAGDIDNLFVDE